MCILLKRCILLEEARIPSNPIIANKWPLNYDDADLSSVEGPNRRGRPLGRWEDRMKEYMSEREVRGNGLEWARKECLDREYLIQPYILVLFFHHVHCVQ